MNNETDIERDDRKQETIKFLQTAISGMGKVAKQCPRCGKPY